MVINFMLDRRRGCLSMERTFGAFVCFVKGGLAPYGSTCLLPLKKISFPTKRDLFVICAERKALKKKKKNRKQNVVLSNQRNYKMPQCARENKLKIKYFWSGGNKSLATKCPLQSFKGIFSKNLYFFQYTSRISMHNTR